MKAVKVSENTQIISGSLTGALTRGISFYGVSESSAGIVIICEIFSSSIEVAYLSDKNTLCRANFGACLMKGMTYRLKDSTGKIIKCGNFLSKNMLNEERHKIFNSAHKSILTCELYLPSMVSLKEVIFYIDDDGKIANAQNKYEGCVFFFGGANTLGSGCTFQNCMLSHIVGWDTGREVFNCGDAGNRLYRNSYVDIVQRYSPDIIVSELWASSTDIDDMRSNADKFVVKLIKSFHGSLLIFWEFPFVSGSRRLQEKHAVYIDMKRAYGALNNVYFISADSFHNINVDKFTISMNFINDYANYIIGKEMSKVIKVYKGI